MTDWFKLSSERHLLRVYKQWSLKTLHELLKGWASDDAKNSRDSQQFSVQMKHNHKKHRFADLSSEVTLASFPVHVFKKLLNEVYKATVSVE